MVGYFGAVAVDYDGTLTSDGRRPGDEVLDALRQARAGGLRVILVTGRIISELRESFPDVADHVDVVVAENGCVLDGPGMRRRLAPSVDAALVDALSRRGVRVRRGEVLLAGGAQDRAAAVEEIHRLELDCQLVFNRGEMMILPSGVTKGTGLFEAFGDLGVSRHSAIGVGDAENDHALLDECEVGVAVANALPSLQRSADVVLSRPDGLGFADLLRDIQRPGAPALHSRRWRVQLGSAVDGSSVSIPSSQTSVLVCGDSGSGKSYVAGLLAERLIAQGYCVLVVDPEGDHHALGRLRGVAVVDGRDGLPAPAAVVERFRQRFTSVVLDLCAVPEDRRRRYLRKLTAQVEASRVACGLPHWVIWDEAHESAAGMRLMTGAGPGSAPGHWGCCLVTYRPDLIEPEQVEGADALVVLRAASEGDERALDVLCRVSRRAPDDMRQLLGDLGPGEGLLVLGSGGGPPRRFQLGTRLTQHRRHLRKYAHGHLDAERSFHFRDRGDRMVAIAGNFSELERILHDCSDDVLEHHAAGGDLSRWISDVFADEDLAAAGADVERRLVAGEVTTAQARALLVDSVHAAYRT